jgi:hypothetical protein
MSTTFVPTRTGPIPGRPSETPGKRSRSLDALVREARLIDSVDKDDLQCGDRVVVKTKNSVYSIYALGGDEYYVSGGWFDRQGISPVRTTIQGCTWGGSAIKTDVVAAEGLFLEFAGNLKTTRIQQFELIRCADEQTLH